VKKLASSKRTAHASILSTLKRGPKRGLTAAVIAERTGLKVGTTRTTLWQLVQDGTAVVTDTYRDGRRGRPEYLYLAA
jgi:predicted ArsR family transcriptional regulator